MNIVIFASDSKGTAVLKNVVKEIKDNFRDKINFIFIYSNKTQLQYPEIGLENFKYDCDNKTLELLKDVNNEVVNSESLKFPLPWNPDILLIQRERWQPEQSIIEEFKRKFNSKIAVIEVNSQVINHIESKFEMLSRFRYPQSMVDVFFEGSDWTKTNRKLLLGNEWDKSIVTGNPRFDTQEFINDKEEMRIKKKYNIDDRTNIIFWGIINTSRTESLDALKKLSDYIDLEEYRVFYKPYPGEPYNEKFVEQFKKKNIIKYENGVINNIDIIYDDIDIWTLSNLSDIHIGGLSSVFLFPLMFEKNIVNLNSVCNFINYMNDSDRFLKETNKGVEDSAEFWMGVFGMTDKEEFKNVVNTFNIDKWKDRNNEILKDVKKYTYNFDLDLKFLEDIKEDKKPIEYQQKILKYFDSYYDGNSSKRIVQHLIREYF